MANQTDFLNDALGQIGATKITAIDDGSLNAEYCAVFWPPLRKALLRLTHWNFATDRASLVQSVPAPAFEFTFSYSLPVDLVKIVQFNGNGAVPVAPSGYINLYPYVTRYVIEGRKLLTNDAEAKIVYLKDVDNPDLWDPLFYQLAAAWLSSKLASSIAKSEKTAAMRMEEVMKILLPMATAVDGQEGTEMPESIPNLLWVR